MNEPANPSRRAFVKSAAAAIVAMHLPNAGIAVAQSPRVPKPLLQRLRLRSNNIDVQEPFYRDVLAFPTDRPDEKTLVVTTGQSTIEFVHDDETEQPFYHFAFTIPENQVERALQWLSGRWEVMDINDRGDKVMHFKRWNAHSIFFLDPVGNILEFIGHHAMQNGTTEPFHTNQVEFTSEIGIVVPNVGEQFSLLMEQFGLEPFYGQTSPVFTAMGDTSGLLIVVRQGRGWFPDFSIKADVFPLEVTMNRGEAGRVLDVPALPYTLTSA